MDMPQEDLSNLSVEELLHGPIAHLSREERKRRREELRRRFVKIEDVVCFWPPINMKNMERVSGKVIAATIDRYYANGR